MARTTTTTATYTGPDLPGASSTWANRLATEVLTTGSAVRVITTKDVFGVRVALVDLPGRFAGGRTYTVWSVPVESLR